MDPEEKIILAFVFKRSGKTELKASEIYLTLSLELGWFSSQQAHQFVEQAVKRDFLSEKKSMLLPTFDVNTVIIPIGFKPAKQTNIETTNSEKATLVDSSSVLEHIIDVIYRKTGQEKNSIHKKILDKQNEKNIFSEVAALLIAKEHCIDVKEFYDAVEKHFFNKK